MPLFTGDAEKRQPRREAARLYYIKSCAKLAFLSGLIAAISSENCYWLRRVMRLKTLYIADRERAEFYDSAGFRYARTFYCDSVPRT